MVCLSKLDKRLMILIEFKSHQNLDSTNSYAIKNNWQQVHGQKKEKRVIKNVVDQLFKIWRNYDEFCNLNFHEFPQHLQ